jgi:hypothetical protein
MRTVIVLGLLLFFGATPADAETAAEMLGGCRLVANAPITGGNVTLSNNPGVHHCWGAISVLQELSRWVVEGRALPLFSPCIPAELPRTKWAEIFVAYVDKYPGRRDDEFAHVALNAMEEAFPCRTR